MGQRHIQNPEQLAPENLYGVPEELREWLRCECEWWPCCNLLGEWDRDTQELRICAPYWLGGHSGMEKSIVSAQKSNNQHEWTSKQQRVLTSCPSTAVAPFLGPLLHWERLMASLAKLSTS